MWIILIMTLLVGCSEKTNSKHLYSNVSELKKAFGEPQSIEPAPLHSEALIYNYPQNIRFQVEGEKVVAKFSSPSVLESVIQYWRHHLEKYPYTIIDSDELTAKISCPVKGIDIYYDKVSGQVIRIMEYAASRGAQ